MKKYYIIVFVLLFSLSKLFACTYTLVLDDSYGDGWNGASMELYTNGSSTGNTYTFNSGYGQSFSFNFNANDDIEFNFVGGSYPSECSWTVLDENDNFVCSGSGSSYSNPVCQFITVDCTAIPPPPTEEDCLGAIALCQDTYYNPSGTYGTGVYPNEINVPASECLVEELGGNWYTFTPETSGMLNFTITPDNTYDEDYDWALFDLTNANCSDLGNSPYNYLISGNTAGDDGASSPMQNQGPTGISSTNAVAGSADCVGPGTGNWNTFNNDVNVTVGNTYVLYVAQFSGAQGYTVDFGASQASLYDNTLPFIESINTPIPCGATSITMQISENILCATVDDADFNLTGPGGPYTVSNVTSALCSGGASYDNYLIANISPPINASGIYTISLDANAAGSISDLCGNLATSISFDFEVENVTINLVETNVDCNGGGGAADGVVVVDVITGNSTNYTYNWSNGVTHGPWSEITDSIINLSAGIYSVTVTDDNGCSATDNIEIFQPEAITSSIEQVDLVCFGDSNGEADLSVAGGTPGFTYLWSNAETSQDITNLSAQTYTVTITDNNGCTVTNSVTITGVGTPLVVDVTSSDILCSSDSDAYINSIASGSTPPYSYSWNTGQTTPNITNLSGGDYVLTVTDGNGCSITSSITVNSPANLTLSGIETNIACFDDNNGSIDITVNGGTPNYTYAWSNSATSEDLVNILESVYTVTVTDANSCTVLQHFLITRPDPITSSIEPTHLLCFGDTNGEADLSVEGGTPGFTYLWSNGQITQDAHHLTSQAYTVTITDVNGCTATNYISITGAGTPVEAVSTNTNLLCYGDSDANIQVTVSGGVNPYTYLWNNGQTVPSISDLEAGHYYVTITDSNDCDIIEHVTIFQPSQVVAMLPEDFYICLHPTVTIDANATGGTPGYTYYWSTGVESSSITVTPTEPLTYSVTVTDVNSCSSSNSVNINIYPPIQIQALSNRDSVCLGDAIQLSALFQGGSGVPYELYINGEMISSLPTTVYPTNEQAFIYVLRDQCNNQATDTIILYNYPDPPLMFDADIIEGCAPLEVQFNEQNSGDGITYIWDFDDIDHVNLSLAHEPLHVFNNSGFYDVSCTATNEYGCVTTLTIESMISVYPLPEAIFIADPTHTSIENAFISFENYSDGAFFYNWSFGDGDSSNFTSPIHIYEQTGVYTVELIAMSFQNCADTTSCSIIIDEFTFFAPNAFTADANGINDEFRVFGVGIDPKEFKMTIYDRWGVPIFVTEDMNQGWNGRINEKELLPIGTYTWLCTFKDSNGIGFEKAGQVRLLR